MSMRKKRISVVGANVCSKEVWNIAFEVGRHIAKHDAILVCGGLGGIMEAACKGAKKEKGLTVGILPSGNPDDANPFVDIPIVTGMNYARNILVARTGEAIIAIGGKYGTLSEISHGLNVGIPVVGINTWDLNKIDPDNRIAVEKDPAAAVKKAISLIRR